MMVRDSSPQPDAAGVHGDRGGGDPRDTPLISDYSVNVLFQDQWDFLNPLFDGNAGVVNPRVKLFLFQHGPHREGLGPIAWGFPASRGRPGT
jgi:hypothetical protein